MNLPCLSHLRRYIVFIFLYFSSALSHAANSNEIASPYISRSWHTEDGLPQNSVQTIVQTADGYLWLGTQQGLARFDGVRFTVFNEKNVPELKAAHIAKLLETKDKSLWIGTEGGGLARLKEGRFTNFNSTNSLVGEYIRCLFQTRDGSVWVGSTRGLVRFHNETFELPPSTMNSVRGVVRSICEGPDGTVWFATTMGVYALKNGNVTQHLTTANGLRGDTATTVWSDAKSNLWAGVVGGLSVIQADQVRSYTKKNGLADNRVTVVFEDYEGTVWIGTYGGLNRFANGQLLPEMNSEGQPYDWVNSIFEDREGTIWVGAKDGLSRVRKRSFTSYTKREGLSHNNIVSVFEDKRRTVWAGTWGGGLNQFTPDGIRPYRSWNRVDNSNLAIELVLGIGEDHFQQMWIGTDFTGGLFRMKDDGFHRFGKEEGLPQTAIRVVYEDSSNRLWTGTSTGLFLFSGERFIPFGENEGLSGSVIRVICEDRKKRLWVGTEAGLNCLKEGRFQTFDTTDHLAGNLVLALHEDTEENLWIGTHGGLSRLKEDQITSYTTADGLASDDVFEILEDDFGSLWMSCRTGVFTVKKKDLDQFSRGSINSINCRSFGKSDGLVSLECNSVAKPAGCRSQDGRLWFPTTKGLIVVDPKAVKDGNRLPPPVLIESVLADRRSVTSEETTISPATLAFSSSRQLTISPGSGELEIHYTALSFIAPEKNRFKYKLEGADREWRDVGNRRTAYYNNLKPGTYVFHVNACNNDGVWSANGQSIELTLLPHVWQTAIFRGTLSVLILLVVAFGVRWITRRKIQFTLQRLEQQRAVERERARIAQDMHDDLGARLTEILLLNNAAKKSASLEQANANITKVSKVAREVIDNLDALVWTVNPKNDSLPRLVSYICEYAGAFLNLASIPCRFDLPANPPDVPVSSDIRHAVLLVVKEGLNNVAKYSEATEVWMRVRTENNSFQIVIEDNGKGFIISEANSSGNGLSNMRQRIEGIQGTLQLCSEPGKGTRLLLGIPMKA